MEDYDVIVIGAGSVGIPAAQFCAQGGLRVLVLDKEASASQGDNKHAIGGIRATHTQKAKIFLCKRSIEIFSSWEQNYGDDIGWVKGGYCYVAYTPEHAQMFQENVKLQKSLGLNIDYFGAEKIKKLVPGINEDGLLGGTFSPEDGNASPLLAAHAFYQAALRNGAEFQFNEEVMEITVLGDKEFTVKTTKGEYQTKWVINAAGGYAKEIAQMVGIDVPVNPTSHEAGITEPVQNFMKTMVIDIRPAVDPKFGNSKNFYFYQNIEGQIIFCITPDPPILGHDREETSQFLPQIAKRMINLLPRLKNIKVRRTWRGLYPDTPDGAPIVGEVSEVKGFILAVGMCGQGYMLGPGLGEVLSRLIRNKLISDDHVILDELALKRDFGNVEKLK
ncbi:MAG: NAD(P)/FAD-dependent oxidoreductase [Promethearchaeota archaeon]